MDYKHGCVCVIDKLHDIATLPSSFFQVNINFPMPPALRLLQHLLERRGDDEDEEDEEGEGGEGGEGKKEEGGEEGEKEEGAKKEGEEGERAERPARPRRSRW